MIQGAAQVSEALPFGLWEGSLAYMQGMYCCILKECPTGLISQSQFSH